MVQAGVQRKAQRKGQMDRRTLPSVLSSCFAKARRSINIAGVRVIIMNCLWQFGIEVMEEAHRHEMTGPGWAWLTTDGMTGTVCIVGSAILFRK